MNLDQILADIAAKYPNDDIQYLIGEMASGKLTARKQLADLISTRHAMLSPLTHLEVSRWGVNDDLSQCAEIKALAKKS